MSEGLYWNQQTQVFLSAHPCEEGWKVYTYLEEVAERLFLRFLPDHLRDNKSESIKRREISRVIELDELIETPGKCHTVECGA